MRRADALAAPRPVRRECVGRGLTCAEPEEMREAASAGDGHDGGEGYAGAYVPLVRSVPFRMGIAFWLLFMICFTVSGLFFYETLQQRLLARIDESILERLNAIETVYERLGIEAVIELARQPDELPMQTNMGFHLSEASGIRIAGNVPVCPSKSGWEVLRGHQLGLQGDNGYYRFYSTSLGDATLSLGRSLYALEELRAIALRCLLWTLAASTLLAVIAAVAVTRRAQRRTYGFQEALDLVARGELDARLPISRRGDDLDGMAGTINDALERLSRTVNGMRQVSTDIAHDLKTPLNRLAIQLDEAASRSRAGHCVGEDLDQALEETRGINATFEALLRIAQIEAGARRSRFVRFDFATLIGTVAEMYEPVADEHGQTLESALPADGTLSVTGDRELLGQLVVNLVENAIHHGREGTRIRLTAGRENGLVWLTVEDDGPGIPAAERKRVFERLYRLERSRTTPGSGLGLSLVKAIADLHCGRVSLEDNAPGLRVTVRFERHCPVEG